LEKIGGLGIDIVQHGLIETAAPQAVRAPLYREVGSLIRFISAFSAAAGWTAFIRDYQPDIFYPGV